MEISFMLALTHHYVYITIKFLTDYSFLYNYSSIFNFNIISKHTLTLTVLLILLILPLVSCTTIQCHSTCTDQSCTGPSLNQCTSCDYPQLANNNGKCQSNTLPSQNTQLYSIADSSWMGSSAGLSKIYTNDNQYSDAATIGWTTTAHLSIVQPSSPDDVIYQFWYPDPPAHHKVQFRASIITQVGSGSCVSNKISVTTNWVTNAVQEQITVQYRVVSVVFNRSHGSFIQIKLQNIGSNSTCAGIKIADLALILHKCPLFCLICSAFACSMCDWVPSINGNTQGYLSLDMMQCLPSCPISALTNIMTSQFKCDVCHISCKNCTSTGMACTVCASNYFWKFGSTTTCVNNCGVGYYKDSMQGRCQKCQLSCRSCDNSPNNCTSCNLNGTVQAYLTTNFTCSTKCTISYYLDPSNNDYRCNYCDSTCTRCLNTISNCTQCASNHVFSFNSTTTCVSDCGIGYLKNITLGKCLQCSSNCRTCNDQITNCSSCGIISGNQSYLHSSFKCVLTCTLSYYSSPLSNDYKCNYCNANCSACLNSVDNCTSCASGNVWAFNSTSICVSQCGNGFFKDTNQGKCIQCDPSCLSCSILNTNCTSCNTQSYLHNYSCVSSCPISTYLSTTLNACLACHQFCLNCSGPSQYQCYSCTNTTTTIYYKHLRSNTCASACPFGQFISPSIPNICQLCSIPCTTCFNQSTNCTDEVAPPKIGVSTIVTSDGQHFQTTVVFDKAMVNSTNTTLIGSTVQVFIQSRNRLLQQDIYKAQKRLYERQRMLTSTPLVVTGVRISPDLSSIVILSGFSSIGISSADLRVLFQQGTVNFPDGTTLTALNQIASLATPQFLRSYYHVFGRSFNTQAQGVAFTVFSLVLFIFACVFYHKNTFLQCLSLVQLIQLIGLSRVRNIYFDYQKYNVFQGFSYYQLGFIPGAFKQAYSSGYYQNYNQSIGFVYGGHGLLLAFGTPLLIYLGSLIIMGVIYAIAKHQQYKKIEQYLIRYMRIVVDLCATFMVYGCVMNIVTLGFNDIGVNVNIGFILPLTISFLLLMGYMIYLWKQIYPKIQQQLFIISNFINILAMICLPYSLNATFSIIIINQVITSIVQIIYYKNNKIHFYLYCLERGFRVVILGSVLVTPQPNSIMIVLGVLLGVVCLVKGYYIVRGVYVKMRQSVKQNKMDQMIKEESVIQPKQNVIAVNQQKALQKPIQNKTMRVYPQNQPTNPIGQTNNISSLSLNHRTQSIKSLPVQNIQSTSKQQLNITNGLFYNQQMVYQPVVRGQTRQTRRRTRRMGPVVVRQLPKPDNDLVSNQEISQNFD